MSNRHAVIDSKPCHAHKCDYCKSAWMCQGVACLKKKHRTCYTCSSPEKVALRAEKKRQEMLRERQSGEQLYIFRARVGVAGLPAPAWFQANGFTFSGSPTPPYSPYSHPYPMLKINPSVMITETEKDKFTKEMVKKAVEELNMMPTHPWIMHPEAAKDLQKLGLGFQQKIPATEAAEVTEVTYCACGALMTAKPWDHETTCPLYDYIYADEQKKLIAGWTSYAISYKIAMESPKLLPEE